MDFADYIIGLWQRIGYTPKSGDISLEEGEDEVDQVVDSFTPVKEPTRDEEKYAGVTIRQLPKDVDHGEVMELLCQSGLPEEKKDDTIISHNGIVSIKNLDNKTCKDLIDAVHGKVNFGKKLFCNGLIPLTPEKPDTLADPSAAAAATGPPGDPVPSSEANPPKSPAFIATI